MSSPSLDAIRSILGSDITPDVIVEAQKHEREIKRRLYVALPDAWRSREPYPSTTPGEYRPLIGYENLNYVELKTYNRDAIIALHRPLMYAHAVTFPDLLLSQQDGTNDYDLTSMLDAYSIMAPLIDREIMIPVAPTFDLEGEEIARWNGPLRGLLENLIEKGVVDTFWIDQNLPLAVTQDWLAEMLGILQVLTVTPGDLDLSARRHTWAMQTLSSLVNLASPKSDEILLSSLLSQVVPDMAEVTATDIISIRQDDTFEAWRESLRQGLMRINSASPDLLESALADFRTEMIEKLHKVEQETRRSRTLASLRSGVRTFSLALAAGVVSRPIIGDKASEVEFTFAGALATMDVFSKWISIVLKWKEMRGKSSLVNHHRAIIGGEGLKGTDLMAR